MALKVIESSFPQETFAIGEQIGREAQPGQVLALQRQSVALLLPLSRFTKKGDCPFTISMCTASVMWKRWRKSDMRTVSMGKASA